jgi:cation transport ATPase
MLTCEQCGNSIVEGGEFVLKGKRDNPDRTICQVCATVAENEIEAETRDINVLGAVFFGIIAAVISALLWYAVVVITDYQLGIVAIVVGWIVAQAVIYGAGKKRGPVVQLISVVAIIFAMALGQYLIIRHFLIKAGFDNLPLLMNLKLVYTFLVEVIKEDPLVLLFWLIAAIEGIVLPAKRKLNLTRPTGITGAQT